MLDRPLTGAVLPLTPSGSGAFLLLPPTVAGILPIVKRITIEVQKKWKNFLSACRVARVGAMHYSVPMSNDNNRPQYLSPLETGENPLNVWPEADMAVTFLDGATHIYKNVRVLGMLGYSDPVKVDGTTLTIEAGDVVFHLLGVRQYVFTITRDADGTY